jgi:hypothetical protein
VGAILGFGPSVGGMLGSPEGVVLEPVEGLVDISRHGHIRFCCDNPSRLSWQGIRIHSSRC